MVLWSVPLFPYGYAVLALGVGSVALTTACALTRKGALTPREGAVLLAFALAPAVLGVAGALLGLALAETTASYAEPMLGVPGAAPPSHEELVALARSSALAWIPFGLKASILPVAASVALVAGRRRAARARPRFRA